MIIAKSLIRVLEKEHFTLWIEDEIVNNAEKFEADVIDHLRKTNFDRNLINYSWQTAQSRSESQKSESARQSSLRERSTQAKFVDQLLNKEKLSIRQRSSSSQSIRQQSFELNRQRFSSSQSIKQQFSQRIRQRSSSFQSLDRQQSFSIEFQNQSVDQQLNRWDSSIKSLVLKKSRRSISLRSFIESLLSISRRLSTSVSKQKSSTESIRNESKDQEKELASLAKLYTNEAKYNDEIDSLFYKLTIFHDMCNRADVSQSAKLKAFLIRLKDLTFNYYYSNMFIITITVITFDEVCFFMRSYFEDVEYRRDILFK
jgi:hypothetical protein